MNIEIQENKRALPKRPLLVFSSLPKTINSMGDSPRQIHEQVGGVDAACLACLCDALVAALAGVDADHQDDAQDHSQHRRRQVVADGAQANLLREGQVQRSLRRGNVAENFTS